VELSLLGVAPIELFCWQRKYVGKKVPVARDTGILAEKYCRSPRNNAVLSIC